MHLVGECFTLFNVVLSYFSLLSFSSPILFASISPLYNILDLRAGTSAIANTDADTHKQLDSMIQF